MDCVVDSTIYLYGLIGTIVFTYFSYDAALRLLDGEASARITQLELELENARKEIEELTKDATTDTEIDSLPGDTSDKEHTE